LKGQIKRIQNLKQILGKTESLCSFCARVLNIHSKKKTHIAQQAEVQKFMVAC